MRNVLATAILVLLASSTHEARACATAPHRDDRVGIHGEEALIVWEGATHTEHFVRRGQFEAIGKDGQPVKDFGFLVPTPTKPTLAETSDQIFAELASGTRPKVVEVVDKELELGTACLSTLGRQAADKSAVAPTAVRVLDSQRVAGLDAVVLAADDAQALATWLTEHGYPMRPALAAWLTPYVQKKWIVTAFKIAGGVTDVATKALRMTFTTDRPFYPYREPEDARTDGKGPRSLDVWVLSSDGPVQALLEGDAPFAGVEKWAHPLKSPNATLPSLFSTPASASGAWLQHFRDESTPRPGTVDLFFPKRAVPREIEPAPVLVHRRDPIFVPVDVIVIAFVGVVLVVRLVGRKNPA
ncbi:MAG: DUF2330 domain-containing protein [Myxococcales bacterium]|nr:DUF2330 domain-containing protein [Myxococcales bacterium]